jgi:hypothetical protein
MMHLRTACFLIYGGRLGSFLSDGVEIYILLNVLFQIALLNYIQSSLIAFRTVSPMKPAIAVPLLAGLVAAHSGVWNVEVDGNM